MNRRKKRRLIIVISIVVGVSIAVGLTVFALSQNINLFYSPTQILNGEAPTNTRIRAGGMVVAGSLKRASDSLDVYFDVTDYENVISIHYKGILPDLFREGQGIVAQGKLSADNTFEATEVLAKHDENYMPPEVADALKQSENKQETDETRATYK